MSCLIPSVAVGASFDFVSFLGLFPSLSSVLLAPHFPLHHLAEPVRRERQHAPLGAVWGGL